MVIHDLQEIFKDNTKLIHGEHNLIIQSIEVLTDEYAQTLQEKDFVLGSAVVRFGVMTSYNEFLLMSRAIGKFAQKYISITENPNRINLVTLTTNTAMVILETTIRSAKKVESVSNEVYNGTFTELKDFKFLYATSEGISVTFSDKKFNYCFRTVKFTDVLSAAREDILQNGVDEGDEEEEIVPIEGCLVYDITSPVFIRIADDLRQDPDDTFGKYVDAMNAHLGMEKDFERTHFAFFNFRHKEDYDQTLKNLYGPEVITELH